MNRSPDERHMENITQKIMGYFEEALCQSKEGRCNTKYGKRKGKLLPKIEQFSRKKKGMQKHTETYLKYFEVHRHLSQSEESIYM